MKTSLERMELSLIRIYCRCLERRRRTDDLAEMILRELRELRGLLRELYEQEKGG